MRRRHRRVRLLVVSTATLFSLSRAGAAIFTIANGDIAALKDAITTANSNNEDDTINLAANGTYTLTAVDNGSSGDESGLPVVLSDTAHALTINGNSATLTRSTAQNIPDFRLMKINGGDVRIAGLTLSNGSSHNFGIAIDLVSGALNLTSCNVTTNGGAGFGAVTAEGGSLTVNNCILANNTSYGVRNLSATVNIFSSFFTGNVALSGAGLANSGTTVVVDSTFAGNNASSGGAILHNGGSLTLVNCTISQNDVGNQQQQPSNGGIAVSNGASITLLNTIIAGNGAGKHPDIGGDNDTPITVTSLGHNLIGVADSSTGWINGSDVTGTAANPQPANLSPAGSHGGPTQTMALLPGSKAIDNGDDSVLGAPYDLTTDQRGYPRKIGAHVDIGAFELDPAQQGSTFTVTTVDDHDDGVCGQVDCTLREAVAAAGSAGTGAVIEFAPAVTGTISLTAGRLSIASASGMSINGPGARSLEISGTGHDRVLDLTSNSTLVMSGVTISHGAQSGGSGGETNQGGGIFNQATLTLNDCQLVSNTIEGASNSANGGKGGDAQGGGVYNAGQLTLNRCTFLGNIVRGANGTAFTSQNLVGPGGNGGSAHGAALFNAANASATINNCTFDRNAATGGNGAGGSGTTSQKASGGDGRGAIFDAGGTLITSATISGNTGTGGKGFGTNISHGPNGGGTGGITAVSSSLQHTVRNTIIAANTGTLGDAAPDADGTFNSDGYNLIGIGDQSTGFTATADQVGTTAAPLVPKLDTITNNGGGTDTMALLAGSPALDAGKAFGLVTDQRGAARMQDDPAIANASGGDGSDIGAFEVSLATPTPSPTPTPSATATPTPAATPAAQLLNISTRMEVLTGNNVLIGGFIVTGSDDKKILVRGLGPSLPVSGALADPTLELHDASALLTTNDNWKDSQEADIEATTIPPGNDLESAIVATLPANNAAYTAILAGKGGVTGVGLVEVYDLAQSANSQVANISTRGFVDTGDNVMIGGVILGPGNTGAAKVLVRGIGPSLAGAGVSNPLADPTLELHDSNGGLLAADDDWKQTQQSEIEATGVPPTDDRESAIVQTLAPGSYTAIVRGKNDTTGVALVELYDLR